jgi:hypothetical protein
MNLRSLAILGPYILVVSPCSALSPPNVDTESNAAIQAGIAAAGGPWAGIITAEGPTGIAGTSKNLTLCGDVQLKPQSKELTAVPGRGVVAALSKYEYGEANNLRSRQSFGDCVVELEFLIGKGSNSGVKMQQRYEIQLYDSHGKEKPSATDCGGIYPHWVFRSGGGLKYIDAGVPPTKNAARPAGEWQRLRIEFKAPRFDAKGEKIENARFESVVLNAQEIHRDAEIDSPTGNASTPLPEVAEAPVLLQLDHGPVAFRNVRVKPLKR